MRSSEGSISSLSRRALPESFTSPEKTTFPLRARRVASSNSVIVAAEVSAIIELQERIFRSFDTRLENHVASSSFSLSASLAIPRPSVFPPHWDILVCTVDVASTQPRSDQALTVCLDASVSSASRISTRSFGSCLCVRTRQVALGIFDSPLRNRCLSEDNLCRRAEKKLRASRRARLYFCFPFSFLPSAFSTLSVLLIL